MLLQQVGLLFILYYALHFFLYFQEAVGFKGLRDDTTCIVIDILPQEKPPGPSPQPKKQGKGVLFKSMFKKKSCDSSSNAEKEYIEPDMVEELFEEGSASLSERFVLKKSSLCPKLDFDLWVRHHVKCVCYLLSSFFIFFPFPSFLDNFSLLVELCMMGLFHYWKNFVWNVFL